MGGIGGMSSYTTCVAELVEIGLGILDLIKLVDRDEIERAILEGEDGRP